MSEMYQQFTVGDVFVAFDPSCAAERRRLSEYRRRVSDDDSVAGLHSAPSRTEA